MIAKCVSVLKFHSGLLSVLSHLASAVSLIGICSISHVHRVKIGSLFRVVVHRVPYAILVWLSHRIVRVFHFQGSTLNLKSSIAHGGTILVRHDIPRCKIVRTH